MMGRSCSEDEVITDHKHGIVTNASAKSSDDGTTSAAHCSIREVNLDNSSVSLQDHNSENHSTCEKMDKNPIDGCIQMRKKVPKHLMIESSSSNSSSATAVSCRSKKNKKNKKSPKDLSIDAEPSSSVDEKDNNKPSWLINSVDSVPPKRSDQAYEGVVNNKSLDGYGSRDECSNMSSRKHQQFTVNETEEQSQESCLRQMRRPKEVSAVISSKSTTVASADSSQDVLGFDLNVDLEANEREDNPWHPSFIDQSPATDVARHASEPVVVMAKVAVPNGLPSAPLQFDGQLAWRSSPRTSAFRPTTLLSNHSDRNLKNSSKNNDTSTNTGHGFDLNIAADSPPIEFESSTITTDFGSGGECSSMETKSPRKAAQKLSLDLNYGDDQKGSRHQSFLKLQMGGGFDLNENLMPSSAAETCADVYHQSAVKNDNHQVRLHRLSTSNTTTSSREGLVLGSGQGQFHMGLSSRPAYWVDMGSIPSFAPNLQGQSYVVDSGPNFFPPSNSQPRQGSAAPLQSKVAFAPAPQQPGFYVTTTPDALPSYYPCSPNMFAPWTGQPGLTNFVPQFANGGQVHTPTTYQTGSPNIHVFESSHVSQGLYSNIIGGQMGMMGPAAGCYPYNGTGGMVSSDKEICNTGNGNANERIFTGPGNLVPHIVERTSQLPQYIGAPPPPATASVKRREPGGGWDSFQQQLNCRRMTAWK